MIILKGTPLSTSHIYKYRSFGKFISGYMSQAGKNAKLAYQIEFKQQFKGKPIEGDLALEVHYYFGDKRKRDIDNFTKLWLDAGTGILWIDDVQITDLHLVKHYDKENPHIEIEIKELTKHIT